MKPFFALLSVNFKSLMLTAFNFGRGKRKAASGVGAVALFSFLMLFIASFYSFALAQALAPVGGLDIMLMAMLLLGLMMSVMFTLMAAQGFVFGTKDIDLVLSLPVSSFSVMLARMLALYLEVLLTVELFCLPSGILYLVSGGKGGVLFLLLYLVAGALLALLPTLLGLLFGALVSLLISRMRHKNLFNTLFSLVLVVGIVIGVNFIPRAAETLAINLDAMRASIAGAFPPVAWAVQGATGSFVSFLLLLAVCVLPLLLCTWLFSLFYKSLLTHLASHHLKSNYKLRSVSATSPFAALFKKEASRFFGTPAYVLNCGIAVIMLIGFSAFATFSKGTIADFMVQLQAESDIDFTPFIAPVLMGAMAVLQSMIYTAAVSISLEGKTLWLLKEAPVSTRAIFGAKAGFNFLLSGLTVLVCAPLLGIAFSLPVLDIVLIAVVGVLFSALSSMLNLFINLLLPRMDAENDTMVIKQSASANVSFLSGWVLTLLLGGLYLLLHFLGAGFLVFSLVAILCLLLLGAGVMALLATKGRKLFDAL